MSLGAFMLQFSRDLKAAADLLPQLSQLVSEGSVQLPEEWRGREADVCRILIFTAAMAYVRAQEIEHDAERGWYDPRL